MAILVPVYGELSTYGQGGTQVTFAAKHSYIQSNNRKRKTAYANLIGTRYPVDLLGGGIAALASPTITFCYWIVAADADAVQTAYNLLEAQLYATNTDGTSGETNPLVIFKDQAGTVPATATARFDDCSPNENDRGPFHLTCHISFMLLSDFNY